VIATAGSHHGVSLAGARLAIGEDGGVVACKRRLHQWPHALLVDGFLFPCLHAPNVAHRTVRPERRMARALRGDACKCACASSQSTKTMQKNSSDVHNCITCHVAMTHFCSSGHKAYLIVEVIKCESLIADDCLQNQSKELIYLPISEVNFGRFRIRKNEYVTDITWRACKLHSIASLHRRFDSFIFWGRTRTATRTAELSTSIQEDSREKIFCNC
jgi:hypothetical protein